MLTTYEYPLRIDETNDSELQRGEVVISETITSPQIINTEMTAPSKYFLIGGWQHKAGQPLLKKTCCFLYTQFGKVVRLTPLNDFRQHTILQVVK